ncbi:MAG: hypothetical protein H8D56_21820 [Planctomycetes bacterium]|nr:hypothetical protein [Planctomycetota bacterium]MBL7145182.1 hypothetical protein [Phycisphaerae bacterium]
MSWDEIYRRLEEELGHEPDSGEVQNRILEMLDGQFKDLACDLLERKVTNPEEKIKIQHKH